MNWTIKAPYTLATKLDSTRSTLLKVDKVDRDGVALAPYTLATKSTVSATKLTATNCPIQVVADLLPKPATKSTVSATKLNVYGDSRLCCRFRQQSTFNKVDCVEFNFVASVYRV